MELTFESIFLRVCHDGTMLLVWFQTVPSTPYYEHIDHCHSPNVCDDACFFNKSDGWAYHCRNKGCICCSRLFCNHRRTEYVYFISNNCLRTHSNSLFTKCPKSPWTTTGYDYTIVSEVVGYPNFLIKQY